MQVSRVKYDSGQLAEDIDGAHWDAGAMRKPDDAKLKDSLRNCECTITICLVG
jgi:hypothetical protein